MNVSCNLAAIEKDLPEGCGERDGRILLPAGGTLTLRAELEGPGGSAPPELKVILPPDCPASLLRIGKSGGAVTVGFDERAFDQGAGKLPAINLAAVLVDRKTGAEILRENVALGAPMIRVRTLDFALLNPARNGGVPVTELALFGPTKEKRHWTPGLGVKITTAEGRDFYRPLSAVNVEAGGYLKDAVDYREGGFGENHAPGNMSSADVGRHPVTAYLERRKAELTGFDLGSADALSARMIVTVNKVDCLRADTPAEPVYRVEILGPADVSNFKVKWYQHGGRQSQSGFRKEGGRFVSDCPAQGNLLEAAIVNPFGAEVAKVGALAGVLNDSAYRSRYRGTELERLRFVRERGTGGLPWRLELGEIHGNFSYRTLQRPLKGGLLEFQPRHADGARESIVLLFGLARPDWRSFLTERDATAGLSWLTERSSDYRLALNVVGNVRSADPGAGRLERRQAVASAATEMVTDLLSKTPSSSRRRRPSAATTTARRA